METITDSASKTKEIRTKWSNEYVYAFNQRCLMNVWNRKMLREFLPIRIISCFNPGMSVKNS